MQEALELRPGKDFLGKYYVLSQIGKGSAGQVFKANHKLMDRDVAIKTVICNGEAARKEQMERLRQEARAASALNHPNLVAVYDYGLLANGNAYTVMDFVEGESLESVLDRQGTLPYERCAEIFMQVCAGMEHAHERGVVHRDLKPSNIMLTRTADGALLVKVVDFGIAKLMPWAGKEGLKLTASGEIFGTPYYMSPEQCMNRSTDHRSDIYSLGCTMYEALMGSSPSMDESLMAVLSNHVTRQAKPFKERRPDLQIPGELESIVMKCLEKDPNDRWGSMSEMLRELRKLKGAEAKATSAPKIRVLLADDSEIDAHAMSVILSKSSDIEVVAMAYDGEDAIDKLLQTYPQVVVTDLQMPRLNGFETTMQIKQRFPNIQVLGISSDVDPQLVLYAFKSGMNGYCWKEKGLDNLAAAVRAVAYGGMWMDPAVGASLVKMCDQAAKLIKDATAAKAS